MSLDNYFARFIYCLYSMVSNCSIKNGIEIKLDRIGQNMLKINSNDKYNFQTEKFYSPENVTY